MEQEQSLEATIQEAAELDSLCFGSEAMTTEDWKKALTGNFKVFKEFRNGKCVGLAVVKWDVGIAYFYSNAVHPQFQGQGIGTTLVKERLSFIRDFCYMVQAHTRIGNQASQAVLANSGFYPIEYVPDFYDDFEDAILWQR
jgi:ribosomal protein S18 acetylase RimI-like enzyme